MSLNPKCLLALLALPSLIQPSTASAADTTFSALHGQSWRCHSAGQKPCASNEVERLDAVVTTAGVTFADEKGRSAPATPDTVKNLYIALWDCKINLRDGLGEAANPNGGLKKPIVLYFFHGNNCPFKNQAWISTKVTKNELKKLEKAAKDLDW